MHREARARRRAGRRRTGRGRRARRPRNEPRQGPSHGRAPRPCRGTYARTPSRRESARGPRRRPRRPGRRRRRRASWGTRPGGSAGAHGAAWPQAPKRFVRRVGRATARKRGIVLAHPPHVARDHNLAGGPKAVVTHGRLNGHRGHDAEGVCDLEPHHDARAERCGEPLRRLGEEPVVDLEGDLTDLGVGDERRLDTVVPGGVASPVSCQSLEGHLLDGTRRRDRKQGVRPRN